MNILINVTEKVATVTGNPVIVCGNSDYTITFDFDSEWDSFESKTARFAFAQSGIRRYVDVVFTGDAVNAPALADINFVAVGVFAGDIHTTTPAIIACKKSITDQGGSIPDPTPDVYNRLLELINGKADIGEDGLIPAGEIIKFDDNPVLFQRGTSSGTLRIIGFISEEDAESVDSITFDIDEFHIESYDAFYTIEMCGQDVKAEGFVGKSGYLFTPYTIANVDFTDETEHTLKISYVADGTPTVYADITFKYSDVRAYQYASTEGNAMFNAVYAEILAVVNDAVTEGASSADQVSYVNSTSGLASTNVQDAIDELAPHEDWTFTINGTTYTKRILCKDVTVNE